MNSSNLKDKFKGLREQLHEIHAIRLHRAISWLKCAEENSGNPDLQFISLWVAFNACYAVNIGKENTLTEKEQFKEFITKLVEHDKEKRFFNLLWHQFSGPVRLLIENQYVFRQYWDFQRGEIADWKQPFAKSVSSSMRYLSDQKIPELLEVVLDRLYTLRNQLIHGGATYKSEVNRSQVGDGCNMLNLLIPLIIEIMLDNPNEYWGSICYPPIKGL